MLRASRRVAVALVLASSLVSAGCITITPINNTVNLENLNFQKVKRFKKGEDCTTIVLGIIPFGTTRLINAVRDGNINKVYVVDYEQRFFVLFNQVCVTVYGV